MADEKWIPPQPKTDAEYLEVLAKIIFVIRFNGAIVQKKWPDIKKAFHNFSLEKMPQLTVEKLMEAPGMIKNKNKIQMILQNAKEVATIVKEHNSMQQWVHNLVKEHTKNALWTPSLQEACADHFIGIGTMTREWVAAVYTGSVKPH